MCPIWTSKAWPGEFLPAGTSAADSLAEFSRRIPAVEGNTTFYGIPTEDVIARWVDQTLSGFHFCLKFPRTISHDRMLVGAERETAEWVERLRLLGDRCGPSLLQLPREFGPDRLEILASFLRRLPRDLRFSVEPRHLGWFEKAAEVDFNALLAECAIGRVLYDVRPLRAADRTVDVIRQAQDSKPQVPVRTSRTASHVHLRYVAHPAYEMNERALAQWAPIAASWIDEGVDVYIAMHTIDERHMPRLCRLFHEMVGQLTSIPAMPEWDVEPAQMSLF